MFDVNTRYLKLSSLSGGDCEGLVVPHLIRTQVHYLLLTRLHASRVLIPFRKTVSSLFEIRPTTSDCVTTAVEGFCALYCFFLIGFESI